MAGKREDRSPPAKLPNLAHSPPPPNVVGRGMALLARPVEGVRARAVAAALSGVVSADTSKVSNRTFKSFNYTRPCPTPTSDNGIMMGNLRFIHRGQPVKYSVEFTDERRHPNPPERGGGYTTFLHFDVTCIDSNGQAITITDKAPPEVKVPTNLEHVDMIKRAIRLILDILKDAAAGGVSKSDMMKILIELGFDVDIIKGKTIDGLIEELKNIERENGFITRHPKPAYHERSVDGLYKMALFMARLLFLETGSLSKFSSFTVFEKGLWRACNAFVQNGGDWNGLDSLIKIIAKEFALHFQTHATIMDPASPCQSALVSSMRRVLGQRWFNTVYGLSVANRNLTIELVQDWCNEREIRNLQLNETEGHFVPTDATHVTLNIRCQGETQTFSGPVYSTVPGECVDRWELTSQQRFNGFNSILLGNTANGKVFSQNPLNRKLALACTIGKENGDCDQMYAILYYAIQLATHRYYNNTAGLSWEACFKEVMKEIMVVTCDRVVYYTCMCLKIPCTYTGSGDGAVYVYEPYKKDLSTTEVKARNLDLLEKKVKAEFENSMKFLSSQDKMLSAVMFCGISSVRYKKPDTPDVQYEPFPNNCYTEIKDIVRVKKDRLDIVTKCVSSIKGAIQFGPTPLFIELLAKFALAIIITNLAVFFSNLEVVTKIFLATFSKFQDFDTALDHEFTDPDVKDTLKSPIIGKYFQVHPDVKYYQDIATDVASKVSVSMSKPADSNLYFDFLATLNNYILNDVNNKCVSTAQERSKFAQSGNLTLYILNNVIIPNALVIAWRARAPPARDTRLNAAIVGNQQGGRRRKKIIQTGGDSTHEIINDALEVNLNDDANMNVFVEKHRSKTDVLNGIIQTQLDPSVLRHLLTGLTLQRENKITKLNDIISKMSPSTPSASPDHNAQYTQRPRAVVASTASAAKPAVNSDLLTMLILERNGQQARLDKENFMNDMLRNDTSEQDKENYWKTRNELVFGLNTGISLTIVEKTVLEMSDIEMLVCLYASINDYCSRNSTTLEAYLMGAYQLLSGARDNPKPLTWVDIDIPGQINELYTQFRQYYYPPPPIPPPPIPPPPPPPNPAAIRITNYLLYGEDISNPDNIIGDDIRILILLMLHIFLYEVIMDMIPDSYGKSLQITKDIELLLEKTYTISSSIDPSNYTEEQIQEAKHAAASMSVSSGREVNPVLDTGPGPRGFATQSSGPGFGFGGFGYHSPGGSATQSTAGTYPGGAATPQHTKMNDDPDSQGSAVSVGLPQLERASFFDHLKQAAQNLFDPNQQRKGSSARYGGSTARTRRKLHRNHRRTQYTNKHKRSAKSSKRATIKHRKSYRKHNRTVKRSKSRRHRK